MDSTHYDLMRDYSCFVDPSRAARAIRRVFIDLVFSSQKYHELVRHARKTTGLEERNEDVLARTCVMDGLP